MQRERESWQKRTKHKKSQKIKRNIVTHVKYNIHSHTFKKIFSWDFLLIVVNNWHLVRLYNNNNVYIIGGWGGGRRRLASKVSTIKCETNKMVVWLLSPPREKTGWDRNAHNTHKRGGIHTDFLEIYSNWFCLN
jgi:hypothetical protein